MSRSFRRLRRAALLLALLLIAAGLYVYVQMQRRPPLTGLDALLLPAAAPQAGQLRVRFAGVSTLLFDDGETPWLADGFFSRPPVSALMGPISPDLQRVQAGLQKLGISKLAAVVPLHSHYDHAMDSPQVAKQTSALLVGSPSTLNLGRGAGLPAAQLREVRDGGSLQLGRFKLSFIASRHSPTWWSDGNGHEDIEAPLKPPALASAWREGQVWSLLVEHEGRSILVQGSAGFVPGALQGRRVDTVFLGVGTLGKKNAAYRDGYWREVVQATGARRIVPIHWDDFWLPLPADGSLPQPIAYLIDDFGSTLADLQARARAEQREVRLAPLWQAFDPYPQSAKP